jgi:F-type H+-transporting ATPase subunit b
MLIDWFTVGAQVLNFLVLVWLLKRYLYKPILTAIDAREKRITDELADAAAKKSAAQKERDDFQAKNKAFDEQRAALLAKATGDAKVEHDRVIAQARIDADDLRTKQADALKNDQTRLGDEITRAAGDEVFAIARKAFCDLASASLETQMSEVFVRRLHELDAQAKAALASAFEASSEPGIVRSTFDLPMGQRDAIQKALAETFAKPIRVKFETDAAGLGGIELTVGGRKLTWSIAGYLASMQHEVERLLDSKHAAATVDVNTDAARSPLKPSVALVAAA